MKNTLFIDSLEFSIVQGYESIFACKTSLKGRVRCEGADRIICEINFICERVSDNKDLSLNLVLEAIDNKQVDFTISHRNASKFVTNGRIHEKYVDVGNSRISEKFDKINFISQFLGNRHFFDADA